MEIGGVGSEKVVVGWPDICVDWNHPEPEKRTWSQHLNIVCDGLELKQEYMLLLGCSG